MPSLLVSDKPHITLLYFLTACLRGTFCLLPVHLPLLRRRQESCVCLQPSLGEQGMHIQNAPVEVKDPAFKLRPALKAQTPDQNSATAHPRKSDSMRTADRLKAGTRTALLDIRAFPAGGGDKYWKALAIWHQLKPGALAVRGPCQDA